MGYRKIPTIHTLTFEQYEGLVVRMKSMKIGEMKALIRKIDSEDDGTDDVIDAMTAAIAKALVSWTLEDETGAPLPATREEVEDLEFEMLNDIVGEWLEKVTGPGDEAKKGSSGGEKFPGRPLTMEAL